jgi:hypothetical protein
VVRLGVLLASIAALLAAAVWTLNRHEPEVVGYNGVRPYAFVATLAPGKPVCTVLGTGRSQPDRVRVTVGLNGVPPQPVRVHVPGAGDGPTLTARDGVLTFALPADVARGDGTACLENLGRKPVLLAGEPGSASTIRGRQQGYSVAYELVDTDPPRWSSDAGDLLADVGGARAGAGGTATGYLVLVLVGLGFAGALFATWRWVLR